MSIDDVPSDTNNNGIPGLPKPRFNPFKNRFTKKASSGSSDGQQGRKRAKKSTNSTDMDALAVDLDLDIPLATAVNSTENSRKRKTPWNKQAYGRTKQGTIDAFVDKIASSSSSTKANSSACATLADLIGPSSTNTNNETNINNVLFEHASNVNGIDSDCPFRLFYRYLGRPYSPSDPDLSMLTRLMAYVRESGILRDQNGLAAVHSDGPWCVLWVSWQHLMLNAFGQQSASQEDITRAYSLNRNTPWTITMNCS